jgi:hypothetical protein
MTPFGEAIQQKNRIIGDERIGSPVDSGLEHKRVVRVLE